MKCIISLLSIFLFNWAYSNQKESFLNEPKINLQIVKIVKEKNLLLIKGSVPGPNGSYLIIERWS